jgi:hypothetical protein
MNRTDPAMVRVRIERLQTTLVAERRLLADTQDRSKPFMFGNDVRASHIATGEMRIAHYEKQLAAERAALVEVGAA